MRQNLGILSVPDIKQNIKMPESNRVDTQESGAPDTPMQDIKRVTERIGLRAFQSKQIGTAQVKEDYIYIAKYSPLCNLTTIICWVLLIFIVIVAVLLGIDVAHCGLDAQYHTLRLRGTKYPITATGMCENASYVTSEQPIYNDSISIVNISMGGDLSKTVLAENDSGDEIWRLKNTTLFRIDQFPYSMVINYTHAKNNSLQGLRFQQINQISPSVDGMGLMSIIISNKKRKNIQTFESSFDLDFWTYQNEILNFSKSENDTVLQNKTDWTCGQTMYTYDKLDSDGTQENLVPILNPNPYQPSSFYPLWFVNLDTLVEGLKDCDSNYSLTVQLSTTMCATPFIIRGVPFQTVVFENTSVTSDYIVDFWENSRDSNAIQYQLVQSNLSKIWLVKADNSNSIQINATKSSVEFYIPHKGMNNFYGYSGVVPTTTQESQFYSMRYQLKNRINNLIIHLVNEVNTIDYCTGNTVIMNDGSQIRFSIMDETTHKNGPATLTCWVDNVTEGWVNVTDTW